MNSLDRAGSDIRGLLKIDPAKESERIARTMEEMVLRDLRRKGAVVGLSGGIDSSVVASLSVLALGKDRVLAVFMPEAESSADNLRLGKLVAKSLSIESVTEDLTPLLEAAGCYRRRDEAIRQVVPAYGPGWRSKLVPGVLAGTGHNLLSVVVESPEGTQTRTRLTPEAYRGVVAATSFKQRTRKMFEYYHADRLGYAVAGTPNRLEYDQGFFVKNGDGAADLKPIAHLYQTQVYQLGAHLGLPQEVLSRPPTSDTYSLEQSQEEFYFSLPYDRMDLCLYGLNHGFPPWQVAGEAGLTQEQVELVYRDIASKRRATRYLHQRPLLVEDVPEIEK